MIAIRNISKSFDDKPVLHGINLDLDECETLVILGPSGQGKTVLIKTLIRLIEPDTGSVNLNGEDILQLPWKKFQKVLDKMGFVFQANALFDFLNVRENLSLYLRMHKKAAEAEMKKKILDAMQFVGLDPAVLEKYPEELSGGMSKRVAIARAILKRPQVIFYDEPTVGLDEGNIEKIIDLINLLKRQVCATSFIVTHDIDLMRKVSDRVALLREGRIVFSGTKDQVTEEMLHKLYALGDNDEQ